MGDLKNKIQTVSLYLDDGRVARFTGPAIIDKGDKELRVLSITISEPKELPPGYVIEQIDLSKEDENNV